MFEEIWSKVKDLIISISKSSDDIDEKYINLNLNQMMCYL